MFNDYPTIGTPDGMRAMTEEEMKERDKRQYHAMQNAWPSGVIGQKHIDAQNIINMRMRNLLDEIDKPKPKPTLWQRIKSWIAC